MQNLFISTTAIGVIMLSAGSVLAAPTYQPTFSPGQAVYVDPLLQGHSQAPYDFSDQFKADLSQLSKQGIQYYVIAAQQGDDLSDDHSQPMGVQAVDRLLPQWTSHSDFPRENYAIIFWVRKQTNTDKGSVAGNVGKRLRDAGVTPQQLSSLNGPIIPALKRNMPADPEGAMTEIIENLDQQITNHQQAIAQQKVQALKQEKADATRAKFFQELWANLIKFSPMGAIAVFCMGGGIVYIKRKNNAQRTLEEWKKLSRNASQVYLEIEESEVNAIKGLPTEHDPSLQSLIHTFINELAIFGAWSSICQEVYDAAQEAWGRHKYQKTIHILTKSEVLIENAQVPVALVKLTDNLNIHQKISASELKVEIKAKWESIQSQYCQLTDVKQQFEAYCKPDYFKNHQLHLDEQLVEFQTILSQSKIANTSISLSPFEEMKQGIELLELAEKAKLRHKPITEVLAYIAKYDQWQNQFLNTMKALEKAKIQTEFNYDYCQKTHHKLRQSIKLAEEAIVSIQQVFPYDSTQHKVDKITKSMGFFLSFPDTLSAMLAFYEDGNFLVSHRVSSKLHINIEQVQNTLKDVIQAPQRMKAEYHEYLRRYQILIQKRDRLRPHYRSYIMMVDLSQISLAEMNNRLAAMASQLTTAQRKQNHDDNENARLYSSMTTSSSASSISSFSSGGSYGGSFSGGSYGGSSGGGSYGGSSGGGNY